MSRDGALELDVPPDWMQGRSVFGGLQAAFALRAMRELVPDVPLRTFQATFIRPVAGKLRVQAEVLRRGQNATHVEARIIDGNATAAVVLAVFGLARPSAVAVVPTSASATSSPLFELRYVPGVFPAFIQHFAARWLRGQPPFTGASATEQIVDVDLLDPGPATEAHVLAIADFIPPIALSHLRAPASGSTLTWMFELLADRVEHMGLASWRVDAKLIAARDGYTSQSVMISGPDGTPVALSRQCMLVFG